MVMRKSRLSLSKPLRLIEHFAAGTTARCAADLAGGTSKQPPFTSIGSVNSSPKKRPVKGWTLTNRKSMKVTWEGSAKANGGEEPQTRCLFLASSTRRKGIRTGIPDAKSKTLLPIIQRKVRPDSIVYSDALYSGKALDVSEFNHFRINRSTLFADKQNHINGIDTFWNQAKRHVRKFYGIPTHHFF